MKLTQKTGLRRLVSDLESVDVPAGLHARIHQRITAEPARVETDSQGAIVSINPAFTGLCGYTFAEIQGRKPGSFLQGANTDPKSVAVLRQAVKKGRGCNVEIINYHKNGSAYLVHIAMETIHDENGDLTGYRAAETRLPLA